MIKDMSRTSVLILIMSLVIGGCLTGLGVKITIWGLLGVFGIIFSLAFLNVLCFRTVLSQYKIEEKDD